MMANTAPLSLASAASMHGGASSSLKGQTNRKMASSSGKNLFNFDLSEFTDVEKMMSKFTMPGLANGTLAETQRKNIEALTTANKVVFEGAQALAQRQSEIMQSSVDQWMAAGQGAMALKPGEFVQADQLTKVKSAYETAVSNAKEMTEIAMKAQGEAASVLTKCFMANIEDMKAFSKIG